MSGQKTAGGMSYQTLKTDYIKIEQIFADENSREIFEHRKEYYLASADKIRARLILARARISNIKLKDNLASRLNHKISKGIKWLDTLKRNIQKAEDEKEFQNAISYKGWHVVKLIPQAAEACALSCFFKEQLKSSKYDIKSLKEADIHNKKVKNLLIKILNSDENNNLKLREKQLSEAYDELNLAFKILDTKKF